MRLLNFPTVRDSTAPLTSYSTGKRAGNLHVTLFCAAAMVLRWSGLNSYLDDELAQITNMLSLVANVIRL